MQFKLPCHAELVSASRKILKRVQDDKIYLILQTLYRLSSSKLENLGRQSLDFLLSGIHCPAGTIKRVSATQWIPAFAGMTSDRAYKNKTITASALTIILLLSTTAHAKDAEDRRIISVTGEAKTEIVPDTVQVSLTVEVTDKKLNIAQTKNDEITAKLLKLTKTLGIEDKNVQTNSVNVQPVYEYNNCQQPCTKQVLTGFASRKGVQIKLTDITKLQDLLEKSIESGVTRIDGINFTSSKFEQLKSNVQILAAKDAQKKAEDIAAALGMKVKKPYRVSVNYSQAPMPRMNMMMAKSSAMSAEAADTIAAGEVTVNASVNADFEIE